MFKILIIIILIAILWNPISWTVEKWYRVTEFTTPIVEVVETSYNTSANNFRSWIAKVETIDFSKIGQKKPESVCASLNNIVSKVKIIKANSFNAPNEILKVCIPLNGIKDVSCWYTCQTNPFGKGYGACWWTKKPCNIAANIPPKVKIEGGW